MKFLRTCSSLKDCDVCERRGQRVVLLVFAAAEKDLCQGREACVQCFFFFGVDAWAPDVVLDLLNRGAFFHFCAVVEL